jgi:anti-sigma-K factor RskA
VSCLEHRDTLLLHAVGGDDPLADESRRLRRHLQGGCPACAGRLAEARAAVALLPFALDPVTPSASVKVKLMARAGEDAVARRAGASADRSPVVSRFPRPAVPEIRTPVRTSLWRPALASALAAGLGGLLVYLPMASDREALRVRLADAQTQRLSLEGDLARAAATLETLRSPLVQVVSLSGAEPRPGAASRKGASARLFWDRPARTWHVFAAGLEPLPAGRTYELWFITPAQEKIPAGTFGVNAQGEGEIRVEIPPGLDAIALAAITDEPAGGSPQPTGSIHVAGALPTVTG